MALSSCHGTAGARHLPFFRLMLRLFLHDGLCQTVHVLVGHSFLRRNQEPQDGQEGSPVHRNLDLTDEKGFLRSSA